jgi:hypothetical protein
VAGRGEAELGVQGLGQASPPPTSLPYKVDTSRPSLRTNWTRLVPFPQASAARTRQTAGHPVQRPRRRRMGGRRPARRSGAGCLTAQGCLGPSAWQAKPGQPPSPPARQACRSQGAPSLTHRPLLPVPSGAGWRRGAAGSGALGKPRRAAPPRPTLRRPQTQWAPFRLHLKTWRGRFLPRNLVLQWPRAPATRRARASRRCRPSRARRTRRPARRSRGRRRVSGTGPRRRASPSGELRRERRVR